MLMPCWQLSTIRDYNCPSNLADVYSPPLRVLQCFGCVQTSARCCDAATSISFKTFQLDEVPTLVMTHYKHDYRLQIGCRCLRRPRGDTVICRSWRKGLKGGDVFWSVFQIKAAPLTDPFSWGSIYLAWLSRISAFRLLTHHRSYCIIPLKC